MRALILAVLMAASGMAAAQEPVLKPFSATYSVVWSGINLGEGTLSLAPAQEKDCYRYDSTTRPMAIVRWTYGSPHETSLFCIRDGVLRPSHFEYKIDKRANDGFTLDFDWGRKQVKALKRGVLTERELPAVAFDRFGIHQAVRLWVLANVGKDKVEPAEFHMVDDDRIVAYKFAIMGRETVDTGSGPVTALRVDRVDDPNKKLSIWLAPDRDYTPVKIENIKDGKLQLRMLLK